MPVQGLSLHGLRRGGACLLQAGDALLIALAHIVPVVRILERVLFDPVLPVGVRLLFRQQRFLQLCAGHLAGVLGEGLAAEKRLGGLADYLSVQLQGPDPQNLHRAGDSRLRHLHVKAHAAALLAVEAVLIDRRRGRLFRRRGQGGADLVRQRRLKGPARFAGHHALFRRGLTAAQSQQYKREK